MTVKIALLCGGDMLASFNMPGVWADKDVSAEFDRVPAY
jgi:hypothetical protein